MTISVLALPAAVLRTGRTLVKRVTIIPIAGAAALIYRTVRHADDAPKARVTPDPGPQAAPTVIPARVPRAAAAPAAPSEPAAPVTSAAPSEPEPVVDPIPLAEAAVDLDVEVTLPSELPIRAYDAMAAKDAVAAIRELTDAEEVRTVLAFEEENSKRVTVLAAARAHLAGLERSVRQ